MRPIDNKAIDTHIQLVDDVLDRLRCRLMGGSIPCLPPIGVTTRAEQIAHITAVAAQITYYYAVSPPGISAAALRTCRTLICAILAYLLVATNPEEHTFASLLLLLLIDRDTLQRMLVNQRRCPHRLRHFIRNGITALRADTELIEPIEHALLLYLQQTDQLPDTYTLRQQLRQLSL